VIPIASVYSYDQQEAQQPTTTTSITNNEFINELTQATANEIQQKFHIPTAYEVSSSSNNQANEQTVHHSLSNSNNFDQHHEQTSLIGFKRSNELTRPSSKKLLNNLSRSASVSSSTQNQCGHENAGQELCYLCHQRQRRNVPVYLREEQELKEKEESQLLAQYQHLKDMEYHLKDQDKRNNLRTDRIKIDAFNLGVSEALKAKRSERPKTSDISRSFIFRKRCKTPPKYMRQQDLAASLSQQIEHKTNELNHFKQENDYIEKMEQMQLAEE
jgi:hypothetical protein